MFGKLFSTAAMAPVGPYGHVSEQTPDPATEASETQSVHGRHIPDT